MVKIIKDIIHGFIEVSNLALQIIDKPEFQRLRRIKQTSSSFLVFPSMCHTRLEHSIGVYYLTGKILEQIDKNINERHKELIKIAGLVHDIGHMAFSHTFDSFIIPGLKIMKGLEHHEQRSLVLFEHIIKKYNIDITLNEVELIKNCIIGKEGEDYPKYYFQIVCNKKNGIDSDKMDYLIRDSFYIDQLKPFDVDYIVKSMMIIENDICFDKNSLMSLYKMFSTRYTSHKEFYQHKAAQSIELMIRDIFIENYNELDLENIHKDFKWINITDDIIYHVKNTSTLERLENRKLYKTFFKIPTDTKDFECYDRIFSFSSVEDCFKHIYFYNRKERNIKYKLEKLPEAFPYKTSDYDTIYIVK